jgi:hypothetical protein
MQHRQLDPKISVSIVFVASMFMSIMDTTIVNVALPSLSRQFNGVRVNFLRRAEDGKPGSVSRDERQTGDKNQAK